MFIHIFLSLWYRQPMVWFSFIPDFLSIMADSAAILAAALVVLSTLKKTLRARILLYKVRI